MLDDLQPVLRRPACKVRTITDELDVKDREIFDAAVRNEEDWPALTLAAELRKRGLSIGGETIRKHRRGECSC